MSSSWQHSLRTSIRRNLCLCSTACSRPTASSRCCRAGTSLSATMYTQSRAHLSRTRFASASRTRRCPSRSRRSCGMWRRRCRASQPPAPRTRRASRTLRRRAECFPCRARGFHSFSCASLRACILATSCATLPWGRAARPRSVIYRSRRATPPRSSCAAATSAAFLLLLGHSASASCSCRGGIAAAHTHQMVPSTSSTRASRPPALRTSSSTCRSTAAPSSLSCFSARGTRTRARGSFCPMRWRALRIRRVSRRT